VIWHCDLGRRRRGILPLSGLISIPDMSSLLRFDGMSEPGALEVVPKSSPGHGLSQESLLNGEYNAAPLKGSGNEGLLFDGLKTL
jgi:hypothetical protein